MIHLFNPENKFWNFIGKLTDACLTSILWLICSLPIITAGASTAAFYSYTLDQVRDLEGGIIKSFFTAWKRCFKKATLAWLVQLGGTAFLAFDLLAAWNLYLNSGIPGLAVLSVCFCLTIVFISAMLYIYPIIARFDFPFKKILADSFVMAIINLPVTVTVLIIFAVCAVLIYYVSGLFFFWIGLGIFFSSYFISGVFGKYTGEGPTPEQLREAKRAAKRRKRDMF